jgi:uncharacterized protein (TIGR02001 family)
VRKFLVHMATLSIAMSSLAFAVPAIAADDEEDDSGSAITLTGNVTAVSDYRFRGVSLSNKDIAIQPTLTVKHESGLYAGVWGSNIAANPGEDVEVDVYAGFAGGNIITYDLGATYYVYPGFSSANYVEFIAKTGTTFGPANFGATLAYVPSQANTGNQDNLYIAANTGIGVPTTPFTINASVGLENGAFGNNKVDWSLGTTASVMGFTLGASYVDSNRFVGGLGKAGVVFSISYGF